MGKSKSTFDVFDLLHEKLPKKISLTFRSATCRTFFFATTALKKLSCGSTITKEKLVNTNALSVFRDQLTMICTTTMTKSALC